MTNDADESPTRLETASARYGVTYLDLAAVIAERGFYGDERLVEMWAAAVEASAKMNRARAAEDAALNRRIRALTEALRSMVAVAGEMAALLPTLEVTHRATHRRYLGAMAEALGLLSKRGHE